MGLLEIKLENQTLVLRGNQEESSGCVLRGHLLLHLLEKTRLKSLWLRLVGQVKVEWDNENTRRWSSKMHTIKSSKAQKTENTFLEHKWTFMAPSKHAHVLMPGVYTFPFELVLPGSLAESLDMPSTTIHYKLKALAERIGFTTNLVARQKIDVVRHIAPSLHMQYPIRTVESWTDRLHVEIVLPRRQYERGEGIDIQISVHHLSDELRIRNVSCALKEYLTILTSTKRKTKTRLTGFVRDDNFPRDKHVTKSEHFCIPQHSQWDTNNALFHIRHKIQFTISLIDHHGHLAEMRTGLPIEIVPPIEDMSELPTYEDSWRSMPFCPVAHTPMATENDANCCDLYRLPSYKSIS
ncbi:hypothetical protein CLU79DRAFT_831943 [Phycomyces nitens]|nr:hypothetical protein CLU79DRAFT_831943 [Phycomyces nitens]